MEDDAATIPPSEQGNIHPNPMHKEVFEFQNAVQRETVWIFIHSDLHAEATRGGSGGDVFLSAPCQKCFSFLLQFFFISLHLRLQVFLAKVSYHKLGKLKAEAVPVFAYGAYQFSSRTRDCD